MTDDVRHIVLGALAAGISASLGWIARTYLWRRKLRRKQAFFGLPDHSESLLVVNRDAGSPDLAVHRYDVFALLELAALIKDCNAHTDVITQDAARQDFGERTEFCVGGPGSNRGGLPGHTTRHAGRPPDHRNAYGRGGARRPAHAPPCAGRPARPVRQFVRERAGVRPVSLSEQQLAVFADKLAGQIPFDTSPRHLAGPGDARHVTHGPVAAGWSTVSDPLSAEIVLSSPDHRHRLQFDPQSTTSAWWRLRAGPTDSGSSWYAEFGELVPAEVLAGFTDALIALPPQHQDPWRPVIPANWQRDADGTVHSPDSMCHIELRPLNIFRDRPSWHIETREPNRGKFRGPRIWHAFFDEHTPTHLVEGFLTALADHRPLQRGMYDRTGHYSAEQEPSPLRPQHVADEHTARIEALRALARSARQQQTQPATTPAKAPTAQPAARR
jgi:hypothetical protein